MLSLLISCWHLFSKIFHVQRNFFSKFCIFLYSIPKIFWCLGYYFYRFLLFPSTFTSIDLLISLTENEILDSQSKTYMRLILILNFKILGAKGFKILGVLSHLNVFVFFVEWLNWHWIFYTHVAILRLAYIFFSRYPKHYGTFMVYCLSAFLSVSVKSIFLFFEKHMKNQNKNWQFYIQKIWMWKSQDDNSWLILEKFLVVSGKFYKILTNFQAFKGEGIPKARD